MVQVTYYLEVSSSWCFWAEPAWEELKQRYQGRVNFDWKISQMPAEGYPVSRGQCEWFYRRSGSIIRSPFMLNAGWFEPEIKQYTAPNLVAQAAKELGATDDGVRLAIANAGLRDGKKIGRLDVCVQIAAEAGRLDPSTLRVRAQSPETAAAVQATTTEFFALQVTQRPTFLIQNSIGDRALFSGIARTEPVAVAIDALMADEVAYVSWKAHFGDPPTQ